MRSFFLLLMLLPLFLFSQESELVSNTSEGFKGISIGLLFEAQTKYPNPYYGPNAVSYTHLTLPTTPYV